MCRRKSALTKNVKKETKTKKQRLFIYRHVNILLKNNNP